MPVVAPPIALFAPPLLMRLIDPPGPPSPPALPIACYANSTAGGRTAKDCRAKAAARKGGCPAPKASKALAIAKAAVAASGDTRHRGLFASNTGFAWAFALPAPPPGPNGPPEPPLPPKALDKTEAFGTLLTVALDVALPPAPTISRLAVFCFSSARSPHLATAARTIGLRANSVVRDVEGAQNENAVCVRDYFIAGILFLTLQPGPSQAVTITVVGTPGTNGAPGVDGGPGGDATAVAGPNSDPSNTAIATGGTGGTTGIGVLPALAAAPARPR